MSALQSKSEPASESLEIFCALSLAASNIVSLRLLARRVRSRLVLGCEQTPCLQPQALGVRGVVNMCDEYSGPQALGLAASSA